MIRCQFVLLPLRHWLNDDPVCAMLEISDCCTLIAASNGSYQQGRSAKEPGSLLNCENIGRLYPWFMLQYKLYARGSGLFFSDYRMDIGWEIEMIVSLLPLSFFLSLSNLSSNLHLTFPLTISPMPLSFHLPYILSHPSLWKPPILTSTPNLPWSFNHSGAVLLSVAGWGVS